MVKVKPYHQLHCTQDPRLAPGQDLKKALFSKAWDSAKEAMAAKDPTEYAIKPYNTDNLPFILDSWCSSYRHAAGSDKIPPDIYKVEQRARIQRILRTAQILMLHPQGSPTRPSGWICFETPSPSRKYPILHYVLIHPNLQMNGLAKALFNSVLQSRTHPEDPIWASHWTIPMKRIMPKWNLIYNPYLLEIPSK